MIKCLLACLMAVFTIALADQIFIYGPPTNGIYRPRDIMDIRYHVRFVGMTKIWHTSATLTHADTNTTIQSFPSVSWNTSAENNNAHSIWIIPGDLPNGNYTLAIGGNVTRVCSKNSDGKAPFTQCKSTLFEYRSFVISNSTQTI